MYCLRFLVFGFVLIQPLSGGEQESRIKIHKYPMSDSTENIEAKLCAYIDGALDAADRAEIENHLRTNPQHQQLINELRGTRRLLGSLPRLPAPPDIEEALQAHLERSVLLGDQRSESERESLRINRWPQIVAAAAIVFLVIGLGAVIYLVLAPPWLANRVALRSDGAPMATESRPLRSPNRPSRRD